MGEIAVARGDGQLRTLLGSPKAAGSWLRQLFPAIGCTLLSLGNALPSERPSCARVVIDEAGQCPSAYAVSALLRARSALLIGDVHQLEPVVGLSREDEQRIVRSLALSLPAPRLAPYRMFDESGSSAQSLADPDLRLDCQLEAASLLWPREPERAPSHVIHPAEQSKTGNPPVRIDAKPGVGGGTRGENSILERVHGVRHEGGLRQERPPREVRFREILEGRIRTVGDVDPAASGCVPLEVRRVHDHPLDQAVCSEPHDRPVVARAAPPLRLPAVVHAAARSGKDQVVAAPEEHVAREDDRRAAFERGEIDARGFGDRVAFDASNQTCGVRGHFAVHAQPGDAPVRIDRESKVREAPGKLDREPVRINRDVVPWRQPPCEFVTITAVPDLRIEVMHDQGEVHCRAGNARPSAGPSDLNPAPSAMRAASRVQS